MSDSDTSKPEKSDEETKAEAAEPSEQEQQADAEASATTEEVKSAPETEADTADSSAEEGDGAASEKEEEAEESKAEEVKEEPAAEAAPEEKKVEEAKAEEPKGKAADASVAASPDLVKKAEEKLKELEEDEEDELMEKVVFINRCAKVVKGGRRFSFSALVVCGDRNGNVGYGFGKANEVAECIRKGSEISKKSMVSVALKDNTIPHEVIGEFGGGRVLLRPASPGTGIIAGGGVRAVVEAAGVKDVLAKSMGSNNHANVVKATLKALTSLRTREQIYKLRGKKMKEKAAL